MHILIGSEGDFKSGVIFGKQDQNVLLGQVSQCKMACNHIVGMGCEAREVLV